MTHTPTKGAGEVDGRDSLGMPTRLRLLYRTAILVAVLVVFIAAVAPAHWLLIRFGWRSQVIPRSFANSILWAMGVSVPARPNAAARTPTLYVANHISWLDVMVVAATVPVCFLAKKEVSTWPVLGSLARLQETIFVDRQDRALLPTVNRAIRDAMRKGRSILLFPEGTTGNNLLPGVFHSAHFAPVLSKAEDRANREPIAVRTLALRYSDPRAAWVGDADLIGHIRDLLQGPPISCTVVMGVAFTVDAGIDRKSLAKMTHSLICEALDMPFPSHA